MIDKLPIHYSFTTPASTYDEEALTPLELAGRQGKKLNEVIDDQNTLRQETENHLENQDTSIKNMNDVEMPNNVKNEVQNQINNGTFDNAINLYAGNVEARLDNLIGNVTEGSTTLDAEVIDIRTGIDNVNYPSAGSSLRNQIGQLKGEYALPLMNARIDVDTSAKTVTISAINTSKMVVIQGRILRRMWSANTFENIVFDYSAKNGSIYNMVLNCDTNEIRFTSTQDYQYNRSAYNHNDIILGTFYVLNGSLVNVFFAPEKSFYIDGSIYTANKYPKYVLNVVNISFKYSRSTKALIIQPVGTGYIYFSDGSFITLTSNIRIDMSTYTSNSGSTRYLIYNDGEFKFVSSGWLLPYNECVIMGVYLNTDGAIVDAKLTNAIHALECVKNCTYVDGENVVSNMTYVNILDILNKSTINVFKKVCCIGDSLTSGHMQNPDGETVPINKDYAYPAYMEKLTRNTWHNCGISGANVLTWQSYGGWSQVENCGKCQLYVIGLMLNDASDSERGIPVGVIGDIHTTAQTYYAGLSKIIDNLININPDAHIFVMNPPKTADIYKPYINAVRVVTSSYNSNKVHCIELDPELYTNASFINGELGGHWTATGYEQMAEILAYSFSQYINKNVTKFHDVAFIPYD